MLICVFVFVYADCWFSHAMAHLKNENFVGSHTSYIASSSWSITAENNTVSDKV